MDHTYQHGRSTLLSHMDKCWIWDVIKPPVQNPVSSTRTRKPHNKNIIVTLGTATDVLQGQRNDEHILMIQAASCNGVSSKYINTAVSDRDNCCFSFIIPHDILFHWLKAQSQILAPERPKVQLVIHDKTSTQFVWERERERERERSAIFYAIIPH